jgi:hypothetical protein
MALFESYDRRIDKINKVLSQYKLKNLEQCLTLCKNHGFNPIEIIKSIQPIAFENAG